jgi:hypothetical protein
MIVIKLQGGLGNQLFQYGLGRLLELLYKKDVAYDLSFFEGGHSFTKRAYALNQFNVHVRIATRQEIKKAKYPYGVISYFWYWGKKAINKFFIKKYMIGYDTYLLERLKHMEKGYLGGYWQTYKYIYPILTELKKEIALKGDTSAAFNLLQEKIKSTESIAVHIRRGDYVKGGKDLGVLAGDYYKEAIAYIEQHTNHPTFFIFSDDIEWVKSELQHVFTDAVFVSDANIKSSEEEFMLMSKCKHVIAANSSYSWWAAMLNQNEKKIVIAPKKWNNAYLNHEENLCPPDWIRL